MSVIVFHHALGVTPSILDFADRLGAAGHRVAVPDLYDGHQFDTVEEGIEYVETVGFDSMIDRGADAAAATHDPFAVVGFSLGVLPAQHLAQTHRRCRGAALCHAAIPLGTFADSWPADVPLSLHNAEQDPLGDYTDAANLANSVPHATLHSYDTDGHLPIERSLVDFDTDAAELMTLRIVDFLAQL